MGCDPSARMAKHAALARIALPAMAWRVVAFLRPQHREMMKQAREAGVPVRVITADADIVRQLECIPGE
jgi:fructose-1,6-bisphosphatase/sedoheptulose 1,7-bisphosphatase-like protein